MGIQVIKPGLQTTIQDLGRIRNRHFGIPLSGSFDYLSAAKANAILGKKINSSVLECTMIGPSLKSLIDMEICITGAIANQILIDDELVEQNQVIFFEKGSLLSIGGAIKNLRFYISFSKDIQATDFLGSVSTYLPAKLGGIDGLPMQKGQIINFKERRPSVIKYHLNEEFNNEIETSCIRVLKGPEFNLLSKESQTIENFNFYVSNDSDRMGIRTKGDSLTIDDRGQMVSKPIYPGSVQCPKDGLPIILGADAQTLGGYPRILHVIKADRHLIGQLRPDQDFRFKLVSISDAADAWEALKRKHPFISKL